MGIPPGFCCWRSLPLGVRERMVPDCAALPPHEPPLFPELTHPWIGCSPPPRWPRWMQAAAVVPFPRAAKGGGWRPRACGRGCGRLGTQPGSGNWMAPIGCCTTGGTLPRPSAPLFNSADWGTFCASKHLILCRRATARECGRYAGGEADVLSGGGGVQRGRRRR